MWVGLGLILGGTHTSRCVQAFLAGAFFSKKHIPFKKQLFFEKLYFYAMFGPTRPTQNDRGNRVVISCFGPKPRFTIVFTSQTCISCGNPHFSISFLINSILHRQSTSRCVQTSWQGPFVFPEITRPGNSGGPFGVLGSKNV